MNPDIEVIFEFATKKEFCDGYRPAHLIKANCLTTGLHRYYVHKSGDGKVKGTITFLSPEEYSKCLWVGKRVDMFDGKELIGSAVITQIYNITLVKD